MSEIGSVRLIFVPEKYNRSVGFFIEQGNIFFRGSLRVRELYRLLLFQKFMSPALQNLYANAIANKTK